MNNSGQSDWRGLWSILWRSFVFLPYMLAVFFGVGIIWLSRWLLPIYAAAWFYSGDRFLGTAAIALWLMAVWAYRRFRLSRLYEPPPSLL